MRVYQSISFFALLVAYLALFGCSTSNDPADSVPSPTGTVAQAVNTICPIMGGKVTDDGGRVDWNGKTVGFCCPDCIGEWNEFSDDEKTMKLAESSHAVESQRGAHRAPLTNLPVYIRSFERSVRSDCLGTIPTLT